VAIVWLNKPCYPKGCAAPGQVQCQCNTRGSLSKLKRAPPQAKINVTSKSPVGDISVVTLIRTDTTLDHSQKAEKVWADYARPTGSAGSNDRPGESRLHTYIYMYTGERYRDRKTGRGLCLMMLGRGPHKNCKNDLDDQT